MPSVEFEPTILTSKQPQTHALDCAATGIGDERGYYLYFFVCPSLVSLGAVSQVNCWWGTLAEPRLALKVNCLLTLVTVILLWD
jgi:hypothetical protein